MPREVILNGWTRAPRPGAREPFFNRGSRFCHVTWFADFHPSPWNRADLAELTTRHNIFVTLYVNAGTWSLNVLQLDRWSLLLLWHLSDISAICNLWLQFQILGGQLIPLTRTSRTPDHDPRKWSMNSLTVGRNSWFYWSLLIPTKNTVCVIKRSSCSDSYVDKFCNFEVERDS